MPDRHDGDCPKVYNNFSLDALFSFMRSSTMDLAAHGGLDFLQLSPDVALSLRLGVKGKTMAGPLVIVFDPSLNIGLTNRDPATRRSPAPGAHRLHGDAAAEPRPVGRR